MFAAALNLLLVNDVDNYITCSQIIILSTQPVKAVTDEFTPQLTSHSRNRVPVIDTVEAQAKREIFTRL